MGAAPYRKGQVLHSVSAAAELYSSCEIEKHEDWKTTEFEIELLNYEGWLTTIVSDYLIQCATKTRIIQDSSSFATKNDSYDPDRGTYEQHPNIAICLAGDVNFSLREICNKIIHARKLELILLSEPENKFTYWGGSCNLHGDIRGKPWHVEINLKKWVLAMRHYYETIKYL